MSDLTHHPDYDQDTAGLYVMVLNFVMAFACFLGLALFKYMTITYPDDFILVVAGALAMLGLLILLPSLCFNHLFQRDPVNATQALRDLLFGYTA